MRRREFLLAASATVAWAGASRAHQPDKIPRIGMLCVESAAGEQKVGLKQDEVAGRPVVAELLDLAWSDPQDASRAEVMLVEVDGVRHHTVGHEQQ